MSGSLGADWTRRPSPREVAQARREQARAGQAVPVAPRTYDFENQCSGVVAHRAGPCVLCDVPIAPGDSVRRVGDKVFVHAVCGATYSQ